MFVMDGMVVMESECSFGNENSHQLRATLVSDSQEFVKLQWIIEGSMAKAVMIPSCHNGMNSYHR